MSISTATLPLSCLISEHSPELEKVKQDLCTKGWTFLFNDNVPILPYSVKQIQTHLQEFDTMFFSKDDLHKNGFRQVMYPDNRFGYFKTGRKEGYRFMSGTRSSEFQFHYELHDLWINKISKACDKLSQEIYQKNGKYLFDVQDSKHVKNLPILSSDEQKFGLFDIVKYQPQSKFPETFKDTDSQVDEHSDPGLFSISLGSTSEGLEMYDPSVEQWIAVPPETMVLWCGHEVTKVSNGTVKPGVHRVKATNNERLTCWYEVCTTDQISPKKFQLDKEGFAEEARKWHDEYNRGISMSKSGRAPARFSNMGLRAVEMRELAKIVQKQEKKDDVTPKTKTKRFGLW